MDPSAQQPGLGEHKGAHTPAPKCGRFSQLASDLLRNLHRVDGTPPPVAPATRIPDVSTGSPALQQLLKQGWHIACPVRRADALTLLARALGEFSGHERLLVFDYLSHETGALPDVPRTRPFLALAAQIHLVAQGTQAPDAELHCVSTLWSVAGWGTSEAELERQYHMLGLSQAWRCARSEDLFRELAPRHQLRLLSFAVTDIDSRPETRLSRLLDIAQISTFAQITPLVLARLDTLAPASRQRVLYRILQGPLQAMDDVSAYLRRRPDSEFVTMLPMLVERQACLSGDERHRLWWHAARMIRADGQLPRALCTAWLGTITPCATAHALLEALAGRLAIRVPSAGLPWPRGLA